MADQSSVNVPWAGLAVVVALVSSTLLVPHAFDQLRPPEKERAQMPEAVDLEIDARLWEDPFFALRRFENERTERCDKLAPKGALTNEIAKDCQPGYRPDQRDPAKFVDKRLFDRDRNGDLEETLVVAALVPGNPFVGAEESRRRTRYALLAGLQSQGYVPDNAERIGLLQFNEPEQIDPTSTAASAAGATPATVAASPAAPAPAASAARAKPANAKLMIPYELLSERPQLRGDPPKKPGTRYTQIALLWVDEAALKAPKLDSLALLINELFKEKAWCKHPRLAIVGPSSSDALRVALRDLNLASLAQPPDETQAQLLQIVHEGCSEERAALWAASVVGNEARRDAALRQQAEKDAQAPGQKKPRWLDWDVRQGYAYLAQAEFLNAGATAADNQIEELDTQTLKKYMNAKFAAILGTTPPLEVKWKRMIATDSAVLKQLVSELRLRLPVGEPHRVVLVAERDSLYSQALVSELKFRTERENQDLRFDPVYFFRGLDGVTTSDATQRSDESRAKSPAGSSTSAAQAIEWPEARDQLDYLRRMAGSLKASEAQLGPISAIGILASDVHDKLLVLQALHDPFADKVFFTTDMDARFLHPRTMGFTRNLIVASSLPLKLAPVVAGGECSKSGELRSAVLPGLQSGTPPLRDMYQTATYLAGRRLACRDDACVQAEDCATQRVLGSPSIYEIGRKGAVPLAGYAFESKPAEGLAARALVAAALFTLLAAALLVWPSTPALQRARSAFLRPAAARAAGRGIGVPTALMVALHFGLLAFALGSVVELVEPGHLGFIYVLMLTALTAFGAILGLYPGTRSASTPRESGRDEASARRRVILVWVPLCILLAAWGWIAWRALNPAPCIDCEPVEWLEGVSAWPSHLIHLLALFAIACALDYSWSATLRSIRADSQWLAHSGEPPRPVPLRGVSGLWGRFSIAAWRRQKEPGVDFSSLWWQYVQRGQSLARSLRTVTLYVCTAILVALLFFVFNDGQIPVVPARGAEHRALFGWTLCVCVLLLTLLTVAVADATMLACRFIWHLNRDRTVYPEDTVKLFAQALGPEHVGLWTERMAAEPAERGPVEAGAAPGRHTLLDDWIDVQVVARRTKLIAPLVIWPFAVLAMLVVARSRLFDNWSMNLPIAAAAGAYLVWLIVLAMLLKSAAEQTRTQALERMGADLRWLMGSPRDVALVEPFKALIESVKNNHTGAFARFFDQPLLTAILVPLGGAGGAQLFDYLLLAR